MFESDILRQKTQLRKLNLVSSCDSLDRCQLLMKAEGRQTLDPVNEYIFSTNCIFLLSRSIEPCKRQAMRGEKGRKNSSNKLPGFKHADGH